MNRNWTKVQRPTTMNWADKSKMDKAKNGHYELMEVSLGQDSFDEFAKEAYDDANDGYSIRVNPLTGDKEMFIAGTKPPGHGQWLLNVWDMPWYNMTHLTGWTGFERMDPWRYQRTKDFSRIAREQGVDVIYGHSRGGAIVADMDVPPYVTKVGLDAAMAIAADKDTLNLQEFGLSGMFDKVIGLTGEENFNFDLGPKFHSVWS